MWRIARLFCSRSTWDSTKTFTLRPVSGLTHGALTLGHCVAIVWRFDMAIIIQEIIPRAAIHRAMHANPLDGWGWGWRVREESRETCVGCASAGLVRDAFWHEMREISDPEAQYRTQDSGDEKKCVFYCNIDRHSTIANERAKPKTEDRREQSGLRELRELRAQRGPP